MEFSREECVETLKNLLDNHQAFKDSWYAAKKTLDQIKKTYPNETWFQLSSDFYTKYWDDKLTLDELSLDEIRGALATATKNSLLGTKALNTYLINIKSEYSKFQKLIDAVNSFESNPENALAGYQANRSIIDGLIADIEIIIENPHVYQTTKDQYLVLKNDYLSSKAIEIVDSTKNLIALRSWFENLKIIIETEIKNYATSEATIREIIEEYQLDTITSYVPGKVFPKYFARHDFVKDNARETYNNILVATQLHQQNLDPRVLVNLYWSIKRSLDNSNVFEN